jgi:hypothetical protein
MYVKKGQTNKRKLKAIKRKKQLKNKKFLKFSKSDEKWEYINLKDPSLTNFEEKEIAS